MNYCCYVDIAVAVAVVVSGSVAVAELLALRPNEQKNKNMLVNKQVKKF